MGSCVIIAYRAYRAALDYHTARDTVRKATDWDAVIQEGKVVIFNINEAILGTEENKAFRDCRTFEHKALKMFVP